MERNPARIVSACATEQRITLAQVKTDVKSNEITAVPELLALFALKGRIVAIDAAGYQYAIANRIAGAGADYLFSLKGNQETPRGDAADMVRRI